MDAPQNEVAKWLITTCGIPAEKAVALSNKLDAECWISTVSALQQMIASDGSFLDVLGCPKPIQLVIRTNINAHNKKSLDKLSTIEVEHLLNNLFPEERYGTTYRARKITGTVLNVTESPEKLMQWGITSAIHAEAVWISLSKWKSAGVPLDQLEGAQENASTENISDESTDHATPVTSKRPETSLESTEPKKRGRPSKASQAPSSALAQEEFASVDDMGSAGEGSVSRPEKRSPTAPTAAVSSEKKRVNRELASLTQEILAPPVPRPRAAPSVSAPPPSAPAVKPVPKVTPKAPASRQEGSLEGGSVVSGAEGGAAGVSLNSRIKKWHQMLCSGDRDAQANALKALSKQAADHPDTVGVIRNVGAIDQMLTMLRDADAQDEYVLWRVLVALNNTIARAKFHHVKYIVEQSLIDLVLPLCRGPSVRVRLQALWIIGNAGTSEGDSGFKNTILSMAVAETMLESYKNVHSLSYTGPDNVNQRYAETVKQLACDRTKEQFVILRRLIPMLRDIIQHESNVEAVWDACYALQHLLDADDPATADALIDHDVLPALVGRLDDPKVSVVVHVLETLKVFAECSTSEQVLEMEVTLGHLQNFIVCSAGHRPNRKLTLEATLCLIPICEGGDQSIQQILDLEPDLFPGLMDLVRVNAANQPSVQEIAENCGLALMHAVQSASPNQLEYFISLGVYALAFRLLDVYIDDHDITREALLALSTVLLKVEDCVELQRREEQQGEFNAAEGWAAVRGVQKYATAVVEGKRQGGAGYDSTVAKYMAEKAQALLKNAEAMVLVKGK